MPTCPDVGGVWPAGGSKGLLQIGRRVCHQRMCESSTCESSKRLQHRDGGSCVLSGSQNSLANCLGISPQNFSDLQMRVRACRRAQRSGRSVAGRGFTGPAVIQRMCVLPRAATTASVGPCRGTFGTPLLSWSSGRAPPPWAVRFFLSSAWD